MIIFGVGTLYGIPLTTATGTAIANPTPRQFGTLQKVSGDFSFDEKTLYGAYKYPVAFGQGKAKTGFKATSANFDAQLYGSLFFGITPTAGILGVSDNEAHDVPATGPYTVVLAPPSSGVWSEDLGVQYAATGIPLTCVASGPTAGEYSVAAGTYTFAAADEGAGVNISYEYTAAATADYEIPLTNQLMGQNPSFIAELSLPYNGHQLVVKLANCIGSKLSLPFGNEDFSVQDFEFTAIANAAGTLGTLAVR